MIGYEYYSAIKYFLYITWGESVSESETSCNDVCDDDNDAGAEGIL